MLITAPRRRAPRAVAALTASMLLLTACGSNGSNETDTEPRDVSLTGAYGDVTIPVTDDNVWALDPTTATELLEIGVTPAHAAKYTYEGDEAYEARHQLLEDEGVELVEPDKLELILEAQPDLIVGVQNPSTDELIEKLEKIAPVLVTNAAAPWDESLALLGQATGHDEQAEAVIAHLDQEIADTKAYLDTAGLTGETVSLMSACGAGTFCAYGSGRTAGPILTDLGFKRPATYGQDQTDVDYGFTSVSEEKLSDLVAPIIFILSGSVQFGAQDPLDNKLFKVDGSTYGNVDFAAWYGAGSFDVPWILNDIRAIVLDEGAVTDKDAGIALFKELRKVAS